MQNWYCLVHFPDDTQGVHLVPGPAPSIHNSRFIKIVGAPGAWRVTEMTAPIPNGADYAAEIWVRPATDEELSSLAGPAGENIG